MGELLVNESRAYASRLRNTYHYSIQSKNTLEAGDGSTSVPGRFSFTIPPYPYPEHQGSQLGIFKLKGFWILNQLGGADANRVSGDITKDVSAFKLIMNGLGLRSNIFSTRDTTIAGVNTKRLENCKEFVVINRYADVDVNRAANDEMDMVSGNDEMDYQILVSNPAGTQVSVQVIDLDSGNQIPEGNSYYSQLEFSIELLPTEVPSGF